MAIGMMFLHIYLVKIASDLLILLNLKFSDSLLSLWSKGSVQILIAARTSITRLIQRRWITLNGGMPITEQANTTMVTTAIFMVI